MNVILPVPFFWQKSVIHLKCLSEINGHGLLVLPPWMSLLLQFLWIRGSHGKREAGIRLRRVYCPISRGSIKTTPLILHQNLCGSHLLTWSSEKEESCQSMWLFKLYCWYLCHLSRTTCFSGRVRLCISSGGLSLETLNGRRSRRVLFSGVPARQCKVKI